MKKIVNLTFLITLFSQLLYGQNNSDREVGIPYLRNYTPKEYNANPQNWAIVQDKRGVMYFGNNEGVLEYDGVSWRLIPVPNLTVRSLAVDSTGRIYVGGIRTFGYLSPDSIGQLKYVSLLDKIEKEYQDFADVWQTHATNRGMFFRSNKYLFWLKDNKIKVIKSKTSSHISQVVHNKLYVRQWDIGLMQLVGDSLQLISNGEKFTQERIYIMLPYDNKKILIGTRTQGLFLYDGISFKYFPTEVDNFLIESQIYHGAVLSDSSFAFATLRGGVIIIDKNGKLKQVLDKSIGLQDFNVRFIFTDYQNSLWLAFNDGIGRVELLSPLSVYDERLEFAGIVMSIVKHKGTLFVATTKGVYYLETSILRKFKTFTILEPSLKFIPVSGIETQSWSLLSIGNSLLVATNDGVYNIQENKVIKVNNFRSFVLHRSRQDTNRIYIGLPDGLSSLYFSNGKWVNEGKVNGINEEIRTIVESKDGKLWLGTLSQGVLRADFSKGFNKNPKIERFNTSDGLPEKEIDIFSVLGREVLATARGIFRFDEKTNSFIPDSTFGNIFADGSRSVFRVAEDSKNNIWLLSSYEIFFAIHQIDGYYTSEKIPFLRIPKTQVNVIYPEDNGVVWFGGVDGIVRYDSKVEKNYKLNFFTIVRKVIINGDSVIFGGWVDATHLKGASHLATMEYKNNALRFECSATSFDNESENQFQYFLEGFDKNWSEWTKEIRKDYTNIPEGNYKFKVRAKNVYEHVSNEAIYEFKILPPFYRTLWAYSLYVLIFVGIIFASVKLRVRILEKRNLELQAKVEERTKEIQEKNRSLESAYKEINAQQETLKKINIELESALQDLKEKEAQLIQSEKMASLGRMVAGIAHEVNNPLSSVYGNLSYIKKSFNDIMELINIYDKENKLAEERKKEIEYDYLKDDVISSVNSSINSVTRIKNIVENLRNFSKLDESELKRTDINKDIDSVLDLFFNQIENIQIQKNFSNLPKIDCYASKINQCLFNILDNAVLAIRDAESKNILKKGEGKITISTEHSENKTGKIIRVKICDNGIGISDEIKKKVFDPFFTTRSVGSGRGLGLSEVYGIIEKHKGKVYFESEIGKGTAFVIELPVN